MKVLIIGYYGVNYGDLLMLRELLDGLETSSNTILTYGEKKDLERQAFIIERQVNVLGVGSDSKIDILRAILGVDIVIWGGGTCFMDEGGTGGVKYMTLAKLLNKKVIYLGVGVDNYREPITKLSLYIAAIISTYIYARDARSLKVFERFCLFYNSRIRLGEDLAYRATGKTVKEEKDGERYVIVCLRDVTSYTSIPPDDFDDLMLLLKNLIDQNGIGRIYILNADNDIDSKVSYDVKEIVSSWQCGCSVVLGDELEKATNLIENSFYLLTARLHPAVVALQKSTAFGLYNYSEKNRKFLEGNEMEGRLIEVGQVRTFRPNLTPPELKNRKSRQKIIANMLSEINSLGRK